MHPGLADPDPILHEALYPFSTLDSLLFPDAAKRAVLDGTRALPLAHHYSVPFPRQAAQSPLRFGKRLFSPVRWVPEYRRPHREILSDSHRGTAKVHYGNGIRYSLPQVA